MENLWDKYWQESIPAERDHYVLAKEEHTVSWQRIERAVLDRLLSFENLQVIEIGAGMGTNSALMASRGARVTILDNSEQAIQRSRLFFSHNGLDANFIKDDAFEMPSKSFGGYDVAMSFGFVEHFTGSSRLEIIKRHFDLIRSGGMAIISVPNKYNLPYEIFKCLAKLCNHWPVGAEYPFTRSELAQACLRNDIPQFSILGDSFAASFNFLRPSRREFIRKKLKLHDNFDVSRIRHQKGNAIDRYLGYALILVAIKG